MPLRGNSFGGELCDSGVVYLRLKVRTAPPVRARRLLNGTCATDYPVSGETGAAAVVTWDS